MFFFFIFHLLTFPDSSTETYTDLTSTDPLQFLPLVAAGEGPVYVMVTSAQEMVTPHSHVRKRASSSSEGNSNGAGRCPRDEKRRATHNEVERRRRDKINNWICKLARIVPDVASDRTKQGQVRLELIILPALVFGNFFNIILYFSVQRRYFGQSMRLHK